MCEIKRVGSLKGAGGGWIVKKCAKFTGLGH